MPDSRNHPWEGVHHRHPPPGVGVQDEESPLLLVRHLSLDDGGTTDQGLQGRRRRQQQQQQEQSSVVSLFGWKRRRIRPGTLLVVFGTLLAIGIPLLVWMEPHPHGVVPITRANEYLLTVDEYYDEYQPSNENTQQQDDDDDVITHEPWTASTMALSSSSSKTTTTTTSNSRSSTPIRLWFRTWGNVKTGIPVLFVHGGPGNAIADYHNGNRHFFDEERYFVIEVDQRGTGQSQPSVRADLANAVYYQNDISIDQIASDFEIIRETLGIEQWIVWGGSFGSTIAINYGTRYPERCTALILRGIYLDTIPEVYAVYAREMYQDNPKRLREFDILYNYAVSMEQRHNKNSTLSPNNAEELLRVYHRMIQGGDVKAIWHWYVFENNLMEEDPQYLLNPEEIVDSRLPEAQSVAFFETQLWLRGSFDQPSNLLDRVNSLRQLPIWICQGNRDEVCRPKYAHMFVDAIRNATDDTSTEEPLFLQTRFLDAGHEQTDPVIAQCLLESLEEFQAMNSGQ